jgi:cell wall-associated NlpC family hydrolase
MHHTRLVGGLISLAVLLTLPLVPSALLAVTSASATPSSGTTPAAAPAVAPASSKPRLTKAQRLAGLRATRIERKQHVVLRVARRQLGVPYVYGGASRGGFDCSGLTLYVFRSLGRSLPHGATDQARRGKSVSLRHLQLGDLVFYGGSGYYHHVAIYAGHGRIIHAPHSGAVVSYSSVGGAATARRLIGT